MHKPFDDPCFGSPRARRPGDRIRVGGIAGVLGALIALAAEHRTQAQYAPRVSLILTGASALNPSKLAGSKENLRGLGYVEGRNIGENKGWQNQFGGWVRRQKVRNVPRRIRKILSSASRLDSDHVDRQRARGTNRRLPRVFAATALFHRKDFGIDKSCFSRSVANATPIFHGVSALCRF